MIKNALVFTKKTLDEHLKNRFHLLEDVSVLNHLVDQEGGAPSKNQNKMVISLINLEHETNKPFVNRYSTSGGNKFEAINPSQRFNMDLLFTACFDDYEEALKFLTATVSYFQGCNSFTMKDHPDLPEGLGKLNFHIERLNYTETHNLWTAMGAKYQPSVIYKVGLITFQSLEVKETGNLANAVATGTGVK